ncbi:transmembrane protein 273-like isoform X3 [Narcine bancroftii]|uniref:transmembrane protein 273-like isoform X3 n=1 Tax=Narcine bancroftii TaxID=1343680 RepID=UPI003831E5C3
MVSVYSWFKIFPTFIFLFDYFMMKASANGTTKDDDDIEVKYALMGAGIGIFLVVSFVLIKIYMIKKHIYENELSDPPSRQSQSLREERHRIA